MAKMMDNLEAEKVDVELPTDEVGRKVLL